MFRHHHISTGIALLVALVLAAAAPSAASARPFGPIPPPTPTQTQAAPAPDPHSRDAASPAVRAIQTQGARVARELGDAASGTGIISPPAAEIVTVLQPKRVRLGRRRDRRRSHTRTDPHPRLNALPDPPAHTSREPATLTGHPSQNLDTVSGPGHTRPRRTRPRASRTSTHGHSSLRDRPVEL